MGTVNVGSMSRRSAEVADMLCRRKVDVCCLQEVRFKNEGVRFLQGGDKTRYKLFWTGGTKGYNGVGIAVKGELVEKVVKVRRVNERLMTVDIVLENEVVTFVSDYAPQVGRPQAEKEEFYDDLGEFTRKLKGKYVILGDLNGHVGQLADGYEEVHGGKGFGTRNAEGEDILDLAMGFDLVIANTFFTKETQKLVTYGSGNIKTTVDYVLLRRQDLKDVKDVKVIPGEECISQHKLLVMDLGVSQSAKKYIRRTAP